jgi:hypothetical protein
MRRRRLYFILGAVILTIALMGFVYKMLRLRYQSGRGSKQATVFIPQPPEFEKLAREIVEKREKIQGLVKQKESLNQQITYLQRRKDEVTRETAHRIQQSRQRLEDIQRELEGTERRKKGAHQALLALVKTDLESELERELKDLREAIPDLTDSQLLQIKALMKGFRIDSITKLPKPEDPAIRKDFRLLCKFIKEHTDKMQEQYHKDIQRILTPAQYERFKGFEREKEQKALALSIQYPFDMLKKRIKLTPEQEGPIRDILKKACKRFSGTIIIQGYISLTDNEKSQIRMLLTPEQQRRFDRYLKRSEKWEKTGERILRTLLGIPEE